LWLHTSWFAPPLRSPMIVAKIRRDRYRSGLQLKMLANNCRAN
jgi:hypothetical protein